MAIPARVSPSPFSVLRNLGIGDLLRLAGGRLVDADWDALRWQLSIDEQPLDLEAFGTFDYMMPAMPQKPSPLREVFKKFTAWDVVLTNLTPGEHILHGFASTKSGGYAWLIHLTIKADTSREPGGKIAFPCWSPLAC